MNETENDPKLNGCGGQSIFLFISNCDGKIDRWSQAGVFGDVNC